MVFFVPVPEDEAVRVRPVSGPVEAVFFTWMVYVRAGSTWMLPAGAVTVTAMWDTVSAPSGR